jgi:hypothetical protein
MFVFLNRAQCFKAFILFGLEFGEHKYRYLPTSQAIGNYKHRQILAESVLNF